MGRKKKPVRQPKVKIPKNGIGLKTLCSEKLYHSHIKSGVCKRLKKTHAEINKDHIQVAQTAIGKAILEWMLDNPEGFRFPYNFGYLVLSKYVLVPFREDRWEIVNNIKNMTNSGLSDRFREIIIKKYSRSVTKQEAAVFIAKGKTFLIPMWYNKYNISFKKAGVWKYDASKALKNRIKTLDKSKYYYFNFSDFADYKIKAMDYL
jgi:hypothetical protein